VKPIDVNLKTISFSPQLLSPVIKRNHNLKSVQTTIYLTVITIEKIR
jgi:hypothetical protein